MSGVIFGGISANLAPWSYVDWVTELGCAGVEVALVGWMRRVWGFGPERYDTGLSAEKGLWTREGWAGHTH